MRLITTTLLCVFALAAAPLARGDFVVTPGAVTDLAGGTADLACTDITIGGTLRLSGGTLVNVRNISIQAGGSLDGSAGAIYVGGDWSNLGSFTAGAGTVRFRDICGVNTATISGSSYFSTLSLVSNIGKAYRFAAGTTQTASALLEIVGTSGNPISLTTTAAGQVTNIGLARGGTQAIQHVGVSDLWATGQWLAPYQSNEGGAGNARRWFGVPDDAAAGPQPIPATGSTALVALAVLLAALGALALRRTESLPRPARGLQQTERRSRRCG